MQWEVSQCIVKILYRLMNVITGSFSNIESYNQLSLLTFLHVM